MSLFEAINSFYEEQAYKGNSPATLTFYRDNFGHFLKDTGIRELREFTEDSIRRWLISHGKLSRTTLATYDRAMRVLSNWLYRRGYLDRNPMADLPKPKAKRSEIVTFTEDEVRAMLEQAEQTQLPRRNRALIAVLLDTGIRIGEATALSLHDVEWQDGWLRVDGKTGERSVPFGRKAKRMLRQYIDMERRARNPSVRQVFVSKQGEPFLSTAATHLVVKLAKGANVRASKYGPHTFRHTFAVEFIRSGGDAFALQRLLGHTTLDMTRRYVHLAKSDLRAAHKRFAPGDRVL
jgi:integrase/recombinase XerD